ncbi:hypothetical protein TI05_07120 [Achromatium sp. WMS3]|nr:hypothetical protein TI05_07120 [Achromatium sp. WMS3]
MAKTNYNQAVLRAKPPLHPLWLHKKLADVDFFVNTSTRQCGISTRGLAKLCGVHHSTLQGVLRKVDSTKKASGRVAGNYATELYNILKNREIFLKDMAGNSPILNGKEVRAILHDVCFDVAHYYSGKGYAEAHETVGKMGRFGTEQFIMIQVGFIPRPESIMLDDIEYLIAKETVQVNKSRQEEVQFFTNPLTGECGIELQGLSYICGGVALKHVKTFLVGWAQPYRAHAKLFNNLFLLFGSRGQTIQTFAYPT